MRSTFPTLAPITEDGFYAKRNATKLTRDETGNLLDPEELLGAIRFTLPADPPRTSMTDFAEPIPSFPLLSNEKLLSTEDYYGYGTKPSQRPYYRFLKLGHLYAVWLSDSTSPTTLYTISSRGGRAELTPLLTSEGYAIDKILGLPRCFYIGTVATTRYCEPTPPNPLTKPDEKRLDFLLGQLMSRAESPENSEELKRLFCLKLPKAVAATVLASEDPTAPLPGITATGAIRPDDSFRGAAAGGAGAADPYSLSHSFSYSLFPRPSALAPTASSTAAAEALKATGSAAR